MAVLLSAESLAKSFGTRPLFEGLTFSLSDGDHVGLVGPNGTGRAQSRTERQLAQPAEPFTVTTRFEAQLEYVLQNIGLFP